MSPPPVETIGFNFQKCVFLLLVMLIPQITMVASANWEREMILTEIGSHNDSVRSLAWSSDGVYLASASDGAHLPRASDDVTVKIWDVKSGLLKEEFSNQGVGVYSLR